MTYRGDLKEKALVFLQLQRLFQPVTRPSRGASSQGATEQQCRGDTAKVNLGDRQLCSLFSLQASIEHLLCTCKACSSFGFSPLCLHPHRDLPYNRWVGRQSVNLQCWFPLSLQVVSPSFQQVPPAGKGKWVWQPPANFFFPAKGQMVHIPGFLAIGSLS